MLDTAFINFTLGPYTVVGKEKNMIVFCLERERIMLHARPEDILNNNVHNKRKRAFIE